MKPGWSNSVDAEGGNDAGAREDFLRVEAELATKMATSAAQTVWLDQGRSGAGSG